MATRFYFHSATDSTTGLPSSEQSTLTIGTLGDWDLDTVNRQMTTTIGASATTLTKNTTTRHGTTHYVTRFVSAPLNQSSIAANTWTYNFSAKESTTSANFPVSSTNKSVYVNIYVWRPSSSTKIGTILDGTTAATVDEGAANADVVHHVTLTGSSVSSMQSGDVICFEVWFQSIAAVSATDTFTYDGTTVNTTDNATGATNHASFLETPENLTFASAGTQFDRSPTAETITISDSSLTRVLSAARTPSADSSTIADASLTRMTSAFRTPSVDTITITDSSLTGILIRVRAPSADTITVADSSLTRLLSSSRAPSADSTTSGENLTRILSAIRSPSSDSTTISDVSTTQMITRVRLPTADDITVADSSLTRMLSATRVPTAESETISDASLTRIYSALRIPSSDSTTVVDADLDAQVFTPILRAPAPDTTTVSDASLTRLYSALRVPTTEAETISDVSLTRLLSLLRSPSSDTVNTSENIDTTVSGRISRSLEDTITVTEVSLTRLLQVFRAPSADTTSISENSLSRIVSRIRVVSADTVNVVENSLSRMKTAIRAPSDTSNVIEASLARLLSAIRAPSTDSITVSELNAQISYARSITETINVTEPLLQRIVTHIRSISDDSTVGESVFYETFKRLLIESVSVNESLFYERDQLGGSMSYATPDEVRPLLGNLAQQRTNTQIQTAIDSAYDEINRKTNRVPPDDWKDTEADFGIIKKIARYKAALEMSIGIKDFEDREAMQKEIDEMFMIIEQNDPGGATSNDFVISSQDETYALNESGLIWSTRYKNLRKNPNPGDENSTTINPDT